MSKPDGGRLSGTIRDLATIVVGVLIALGANAWWEGHKDRGRERDYMRQLTADLSLSEIRLDSAIHKESRALDATMALMKVLPSATLAERDTLDKLLNTVLNYSDPRIVLGTINALQQTGDLNLLRNDSLRAGVSAYASGVTADWAEFSRFIDFGMQAGLYEGIIRGSRANRMLPSPAPLLVQAKADPEITVALFRVGAGTGNRLNYLKNMRDDTHHLLDLTRKAAAGK